LNEQTVNGAQERVNAARAPHVELDRAEIALSRARLDERRAEAEVESARKQLAAMWGDSELLVNGQLAGGVDADLFDLPVVGEYADLVRRMTNNPDFLRFASEARLRDAELRLASTLRKPDLTVSGGIRQLQGSHDQALVGSVSVPLFSGRRAQSYMAEARAQRESVDVEKHVARMRAEAMLQELHQELRTSVLEAETLRSDVLPRVREALEETQYAYDRGRYSYLELVDAQREYIDIQRALIESSSSAQALQTEIERLTNAPLIGAP
jgi:cobalt-zinc-cadmium efflux system outer membrane protein